MNIALRTLSDKRPEVFTSEERGSYVITNAWAQVEYKAKTGRSVPRISEVADPGNIQRLAAELETVSYVVACGDQAQHAVALCIEHHQLQAKTAMVGHLSQRAINHLGNSNEVRLDKWVSDVIGQL